VRRGKLVYFEAFGYRDKAAGTPMTTDAIFNIASMTKPMVAVAALQLYEQGKLLMDDPLAKYFPQFADMHVAVLDARRESIIDKVATTRKITIQDLFRHTSGLSLGGRAPRQFINCILQRARWRLKLSLAKNSLTG
jgi:CubicO group peptidase (beta-lactamase class C family)